MGFITPLTNHFCLLESPAYDQRRASAHLSVCRQGVSVAAPLRHPKVTDQHIARVIAQACKSKPVGADLLAAQGAVASSKMVSIGG